MSIMETKLESISEYNNIVTPHDRLGLIDLLKRSTSSKMGQSKS